MKISCVCQSGLGTSFMVQMTLQAILQEEGLDMNEFQLDHMDVGSATPNAADYFFVETTLAPTLTNIPSEKIVPLTSMIDKEEIRKMLNKVLDHNGIHHN